MLAYETERHARQIFRRLIVARVGSTSSLPTEMDAATMARAALRIANACALNAQTTVRPIGTLKPIIFESLVDQWQRHAFKKHDQKERSYVVNRLRRYVFSELATRPVVDITSQELVALLRSLEDQGRPPLAHRIRKDFVHLYRFAIASGYAHHNPAAELHHALFRWKPRRRKTILLPERIGQLLRAIDTYEGTTTSKYMLRLMPLVFVRPSELREAEWLEINLGSRDWRIPARRMKGRHPHIVPLSSQAIRIFRQLWKLTGRGRYVFPSDRSKSGMLCAGLCKSMLESIGFSGEMTMSGFRSMAATLLSEQGWNIEAIDRQLSHVDPVEVRRTYNFAEYLPERRRMMQAWADYLDNLKAKAKRVSGS